MRTPQVKNEDIDNPDVPGAVRKWWVIDAAGIPLGRTAVKVASILKGKHKPQFTPNVDVGDFVIVINAEKIELTGRKLEQKRYYRHSGWPGGLKERTAQQMLEEKPEEVMKHAVKGMLPKSRLGRNMIRKLKVYVGSEHPHDAQQPQPLSL